MPPLRLARRGNPRRSLSWSRCRAWDRGRWSASPPLGAEVVFVKDAPSMQPSMIFEGILFHLEQARAQQYTTPSVGTTGVLAAERRTFSRILGDGQEGRICDVRLL